MIQCCEDNAADTEESSHRHPLSPLTLADVTDPASLGWRLQVFLADTKHVRFVTVCVTCHEKVLSSHRDVTQLTS